MKHKGFREWLSFREDMSPAVAPANQPAANPKAAVLQTLQTALKSPPPPGVQPQQYKNRLQQAMQVTQTGNPASAAQAVDLANLRSKIT